MHEDQVPYFKYTRPARLDKAIHTLQGIVQGISIDGEVNDTELKVLTGWLGAHLEFSDRHPFNEVIPRIQEIVADGLVDDEEKADLLWLCDKFGASGEYYDAITADMQRLQGLMGGIVADDIISKSELTQLQAWMDQREHLKTCWPYDELESLILAVLADGSINDDEHRQLLAFFADFVNYPGAKSVDVPNIATATVRGVCATCPEIAFADRSFCFTGSSDRYDRRSLAELIEQLGGRFSPRVVKSLDYLVVGAAGNQCWAYACYGRKVEQAIELRRKGIGLLLVHEFDFFDAVEES